MFLTFKNLFRIIFLTVIIFGGNYLLASETNGTVIDSANYKIARFVIPNGLGGVLLNNEAGYINFRPSFSNFYLRITDIEFTGYSWGDRVGYINFNSKNCDSDNNGLTDKGNFNFCSNGNEVSNFKVGNTAEGQLSGFAWGENTGWINFNSKVNCDKDNNNFSDLACGGDNTTTLNGDFKVKINSNGEFEGYAWSQNFGYIEFDCRVNGACIKTDWRPKSVRDSGNNSGGGSSTTPPVVVPPTEPVVPPVVVPPTEPIIPIVTPPVIPPTPPTDPILPPVDLIIPVIEPVNPPNNEGNPPNNNDEIPEPKTTGQAISDLIDAIFNPNANNPIVDQGEITSALNNALTNISQNIIGEKKTEAVKQYFEEKKEIVSNAVNTPVGNVTSKATTTVGVVSGAYLTTTTALFVNPLTLADLFLIPIRIWGLLMIALGIKKRNLPWGTVYDSVTKQPLDPAYVVLRDLTGNEVATSITDLDGRYGFLVPAGRYIMTAGKTNYTFPSTKLAGKSYDELYQDLYFSGIIDLKEGGVISKNIPMDPIKFDWNEFAKKDKKLMKFFSKRDIWISRISNFIFYFGFLLTIIIVMVSPNAYNFIILGVYLVMAILNNTILKPRSFGRIKYRENDTPLSFAIMRIFSKDSDREVIHKVTDKTGKYFCLIPNGLYYAKIENKNFDETYSPAHISGLIEVKKGYLNKEFHI